MPLLHCQYLPTISVACDTAYVSARFPLKIIPICKHCLQSVQNAAARLTFGIRRSENITDALIGLHWLRVPSSAHLLQTGRPNMPSYPRHRTYISAVMFHSSCRHVVKTTAAILSLSATGSAARSSHYCRQAGVPSFWS